MRDIRIGNDFTIKWSLYKNDGETRTPYEVTGAAVLKLCSAYGTREVYGWQASGNTIVWTFRGADQRHLGPYQLVYIENEGTPNMMTVDTCDAFCLVSQSCQQSDPSELLMLESDIVFAEVRMIDDELSATSPNAISNRAVTEALGKKVDAVPGKGLSTEDFTTADKEKLQSLENYDDKDIREALNKKQDAIDDLDAIRSGAQKGATALQEHQDISHLATKQEVEDELKKKADTDGSYPLMSVGYSANLLGRGESVPAEFSFRASGEKSIKDGLASIKTLKGNSVVWNQKNDDPYFLNSSIWDSSKITVTINNGVLHGVVSKDSSPAFYGNISNDANHIYAYTIDYIATEGRCYIYAGGNGVSLGNNTGTRQVKGIVFKSGTNASAFAFYPNIEAPVGSEFDVYGIRLYDLTLMFGEGNEPTTIEEFYSRCPIGIDMNAYNEGEVIHMTAEGIKSVGDNAWDEEWELGKLNTTTGEEVDSVTYFRAKNYIRVIPNTQYYFAKPIGVLTYLMFYDESKNFVKWLDPFATSDSGGVFTTPNAPYMRFMCANATYNNDIMLTLVHSGWKQDTNAGYQPYWEDNLMFDQRIKDEFPDGMKKWDKVYNKDSKGYIVKGTGVVDMGELDWVYTSGNISKFSTLMKSDAEVYEDSVISNMISPIYITNASNFSVPVDKIIYRAGLYIGVYDSSYTDAESFKAAMAGVPLYYELAEPTIIEYDEPFNLDYKVADFGTEQAIGNSPSAPISADIIYQFNAVDMIREHEIEINELKNLIAEMQTKLNSLNS